MNLNHRLLLIPGSLLIAGASVQAALGMQGSTVKFDVVSEEPGSVTVPGDPAPDLTATAMWQEEDQIAITTVGYRDCPVLPGSITASESVISIDLTAVSGQADCGTSLESFTTVIRLTDWNQEHPSRLEVNNETN
jgi:hypothetical protein